MEEVEDSGGRGAASGRDWTKGSTVGNLLRLSWPMIIGNGLYMVGQAADMIWVGRLGTASIAGVGVAGIAVMLVLTAKFGLIMGARAMIARLVGSGDIEGANHVAQQALVISAVYGLVMTAVGVYFAEPALRLLGLEADVVAEGAVYMRIVLAGWVAMSFWLMSFSIMQASGDAMTPMKISVFIRIAHLALAPFLVFGWWIFPRLGVSGAALSNVIYQILGMVLGLWVLFTGRSRLRLTLRNFRLDPNMIWRIVKIGLPASIMGVQMNLGQLAITWFMAPFGTLAVAAHSLEQRIQMVLFLPGMGLGMAAGVLVGQNLGAHQPERAERSGWLAIGFVEAVMIVWSVVVLLWAENMIRIFSTEPSLVEIGSTFLRIAAAGYLVIGFIAVMQNAISGAGDTLPPMLISLVMVWVVQLPLAFFLPRVTDLGVYGVRWAIVAGLLVAAAAYIIYFRLGRWKHKRV